MKIKYLGLFFWLCSLPSAAILAADDKDNVPILRLNAGGPISSVTALAFSPDGKVLYAAGRDKFVHAWVWQDMPAGGQQFVYRPELSWRVPIGPRQEGTINALAISDDRRYLAAAGVGRQRDARVAGLRDTGLVWPSGTMAETMWLDEGTIYVFDIQTRQSKSLRGHRGAVAALKFAPSHDNKPPILVSVGEEQNPQETKTAVRVWDIAARQQIASVTGFPPQRGNRPGLSVWHYGNGKQDLRVAIAMNDTPQKGLFRVWDAGTNRWRAFSQTNPNAFAVVQLPDRDEVLLAASGEIESWQLPPGDRPNLRIPNQTVAPISNSAIPRDTALLKSRPDGARDIAAFVLALQQPNDVWDVELRFVDLATGQLRPQGVKLWNGKQSSFATLAADPSGEFVAVSGNGQGEVLVYRTADLLNGRANLVQQPLLGTGLTSDSVAFVRNGDELGLLLSMRSLGGDEAGTSQVFNITQRELTPATQDWKTVAPNNDGWRATKNANGLDLELQKQNEPERPLGLQDDAEVQAARIPRIVDSFAICGAKEHCPVPVVAVATRSGGFPRLSLYHLETGQELRRFTGHVEPIIDMAFSDDGRLLATTSLDRTVRVWWLADLAETLLGQRGLIRDAKFEYQNGAVEVKSGKPGLPAGTRITAAVQTTADGQKVQKPFGSLWDFYWHVSLQKPGPDHPVFFQVEGRAEPLRIIVDQAIDERKPLFSLFFPDAQAPAWIGWHPVGKYDARGRDAELSLGWHFNTGDPDIPTRFAATGEYRRQNFAPSLLQHLVENGAPPIIKPPTPDMSLEILAPEEELTRFDVDNQQLLTRSTELTAIVDILQAIDDATLSREEFPLSNIKSLQWRLGGEAAQFHDFRLDDHAWEADLSQAAWQPGVRQFLVRLITDEQQPRTFEIVRNIRFQRPAPNIDLGALGKLLRVDTPRLDFAATVNDRSDDVEVTLRQTSQQDGKSQTTTIGPKLIGRQQAAPHLDSKITLQPGVNLFEVIAVNKNALEGFEALETNRRTFTVEYTPAGPPVITLSGVEEISGRGAVPFADGTVIVHKPTLKLTGKIDTDGELQTATIQTLVENQTKQTVNLDVVGQKTLAIQQELPLIPGPQTIRITAQTVGNRKDSFDLQVDYHPPVPGLTLIRPQTSQIKRIAPEKPEVEIEVGLSSPDGIALADQQLDKTAKIMVNGQSIQAPVKIKVDADNPQSGKLTATAPLTRGKNQINVLLENQWGEKRLTELITVKYQIPPLIGEIELKQLPNSKATAACTIVSPEEIEQPHVWVAMNGKSLSAESFSLTADALQPGHWNVGIEDLQLELGSNQLQVRASTIEGDTERISNEILLQAPPPQPKPFARIISPTNSSAIQTSRVTVSFAVQSASQLKYVDLIVNYDGKGEQRLRWPANKIPIQKNEFGKFEMIEDWELDLQPGYVNLSIQAANAGGIFETNPPVKLNVMNQPVRIVIDRIIVPAAGGQELTTNFKSGRTVFSGVAGDGHVKLVGHVQWSKEHEQVATHQQPRFLKISVNGFLQRAELDLSTIKEGVAHFEANVILNRQRENRIRVELPDQANERVAPYFADCENPETRQQLHLVVLGVAKDAVSNENLADGQQLLDSARAAFLLQTQGSVFSGEPQTYGGPLVGEQATRTKFKRRLDIIKRKMRKRGNARQPNDVVIFYYQGKEVVHEENDDFILATHGNWAAPRTGRAISGTWLMDRFGDLPGAHLVLLENQRETNLLTPKSPPLTPTTPIALRRIPKLGTLGLFRVVRSNAKVESDLLLAVEQSMSNAAQQGMANYQLGLLSNDVQLNVFRRGLGFEFDVDQDLQSLVLLRSGN